MQKYKTVKYAAAFVEYLSCFAAKHGTDKLRDIANGIQPGMFPMLCEKIVTENIRKVRSAQGRKTAGVFAADILTKGQIPPDLWGNLLQEVIALFELPVEEGDDAIIETSMEGKRKKLDGRQILGKNWTGDKKFLDGRPKISPVLLYGCNTVGPYIRTGCTFLGP